MAQKTTVFCAVYSKDPDREVLIQEHLSNLRSQTVPVEPIYVFEDGDPVAQSLLGVRSFTANLPLTIYEAWNLAVAMARTPYLMNLNLDDRLYNDAVERFESHIESTKADLVGGDWKVCFSQQETNAVATQCFSVTELPHHPQWPPISGRTVRLGSGTGERGTYGPATLWRASAHVGFPRYPYRTSDGMMIRSVGDAVWWTLLRNVLSKHITRLPMVVGNYHSHPVDQAEFRWGDEWGLLKSRAISKV